VPTLPVILTSSPVDKSPKVTLPSNETSPVTSNVPAITVLPVADATVNLSVFISKSPSIPVALVTSNVPPNVVLPVTSNVVSNVVVFPFTVKFPPNVLLPETPNVLPTFNAPPIPAPPTNAKAPVVVLLEAVLENILVSPHTFNFLPIATPPAICTALQMDQIQ